MSIERKTTEPMQITERELRVMTSDLDQLHRDHLPELRSRFAGFGDELAEQVDRVRGLAHRDATRRNFLRGGLVTAGALGGGALIAACGSAGVASTTQPTAAASTDLTVARLAASLEVLAVSTYSTALMGAQAGSFGAVPPAFGTFATTARAQHMDHQNAWNSALASAGLSPQTNPDPKYKAVVDNALPGLHTIGDVAKLALTLETIAYETYTKGSSLVTTKQNRLVALTIAPVEAQHAAILSFILGQYPVPSSFIATDMAASPSDLG